MLAMCYPATTLAVTLYKWVDDQGNISYQDTPPPTGRKYEEKSFSDQGARTGSTNAEVALSRAVQESPVVLYTANNCDSCDLASKILESNNIPYDTVGVDTDSAAQQELIELIGSIRVPTLIIGDEVLNGSNRTMIENALTRNGYPKVQVGSQ
jgi:glutaredoxin